MRKTCKIVTCFYIDFSSAKLFLRLHIADLLSGCLLGRNLDHFGDQGVTLLGVGKALEVEDLKFAVLLDKSDDGNRIVGEWGPIEGRVRS